MPPRRIAHRDTYHTTSRIFDRRIAQDHFQFDTTYNCDYSYYLPKKRYIYKWPKDRSEKPEKPTKPHTPLDMNSLSKWRKDRKPSFDLLWEPKEIVGTNPHEKPVLKHLDVQKLNKSKQETRPPLKGTSTLLSPSVYLNELIAEDREVIIKNLYKSDWTRSAEEAVEATFTKLHAAKASNESTVDPNVTLVYNPDVFPALPVGWRSKARQWDNKQDRRTVDSTKAFWLKAPVQETGIMESAQLVSKETKQEIAKLIAEDKLRQVHDKLCVTYGGFKPHNSRGVSLRRQDFPIEHPGLSVGEMIRCRYRK